MVSLRDGRRDRSVRAGAQISSRSPIKQSLETAGATQGTGTTMASSQPGAPSPSRASSRLLRGHNKGQMGELGGGTTPGKGSAASELSLPLPPPPFISALGCRRK